MARLDSQRVTPHFSPAKYAPKEPATFDLRVPVRSGHFLGFFSEPSSDLEVGFKGLYIALRLGKTCTLWLFKLHSHGKIHHF